LADTNAADTGPSFPVPTLE